MNRYPLWKYVTIVVALLIATLYTLPNFFGEAPAVQVSSGKATIKVDLSMVSRVEQVLAQQGLAAEAIQFDGNSVKARFASTDLQIKARDTIDQALNTDPTNPGHVVALNLLPRTPAWLQSFGAAPMYLGLDLRGGVHFMLQVDMPGALVKRAEAMAGDVRSALREKNLRAIVRREGQALDIRLRDAESLAASSQLLSTQFNDWVFTESAAEGEFRLTARLKPEGARAIQQQALKQNINTLNNRINELGVAEPVIQQQGQDRIVVQLPGVQDTAKAKDILGRTATLEVRMVEAHGQPGARDYNPARLQEAEQGLVPPGTELIYSTRDGRKEPLLLSREVVFSGENLTGADASIDQQNSSSVVSVTLDGKGGAAMRAVTRDGIKRRMAVVLIEKGRPEVLTAPTIQSELSNRFQITGMNSPQEATDLALLMRAGSLAAPMEIIEERTIGPSLGAENIAKGFNSVIGGFIVIAIFMCVYYMLFGVFSSIALAVNLLLLVAVLSMLQATLTLPGIAAMALALGMAIDSNVLINERIREELRNGAAPQSAIHAGYEHAWGTILDSNITTLIAGVALLAFGTGPVRGFAVVHCIGILTSMFSAVFFSRGLVNLWYGRQKKLKSVSIGTVWKPEASPSQAN